MEGAMAGELIKVAVASFVSGITGAMVGSVIMVVSMRVDIRWIKGRLEDVEADLKDKNRNLHDRIDKTKTEFNATIAALRKRLENTRDMVLKHLP